MGGATVYALQITREIARLGHKVHVISPSSDMKESYSIEAGVVVHRIPILNKPFLGGSSFWFKLAEKYNQIRKNAGGFDVLHSNGMSAFSLPKRWTREPTVVTVHHLTHLVAQHTSIPRRLLDLSGETALGPTIERIVISRADKIIAVSDFTRRALISTYGVPSAMIKVVYHGVKPQDYNFAKEETLRLRTLLGLSNSVAFLFVGRMDDRRKNLPFLLKAFRVLCEKGRPQAKLVVVGHGNLKNTRILARSLGIEKNVILMGYVSNDALRRLYNACDVLVSCSILEGFGLTILEAMAAGKPVIATRVGGCPEIVRNGKNGILIHPNNINELTNALTFYIENPKSANRIGELNRKYVSANFNWKKSAELTECVYESMLDSKNDASANCARASEAYGMVE